MRPHRPLSHPHWCCYLPLQLAIWHLRTQTLLWSPAHHPQSEDSLAGRMSEFRGVTERICSWKSWPAAQNVGHPHDTTAAMEKHEPTVQVGKLGTSQRCKLLLAPLAATIFSRQFSQALRRFHSNINCWLTKLLRHFQSSSADFQENCTYRYPAVKHWQWILKGKECSELVVSRAWSTTVRKTDFPQNRSSLMNTLSQENKIFSLLVDKILANMNGE